LKALIKDTKLKDVQMRTEMKAQMRLLKRYRRSRRLSGFTLLEMIISLAFIAILLLGASEVFYLSLNTVDRSRQYTTAELMAHDLLELVVSKRNEDWNSLVPGQYYFVDDLVSGIGFASGSENIEEFNRSVYITAVYRDGGGNIVTSGGTLDIDSMKAEAVVTWNDRFAGREIRLVEYLTNWKRF
jgi:prepilin-type N-terminal cleavage/methylation domain-containing protein